MTNVNLSPLPADPKKGLAKSGMSRPDFDRWVLQKAIPDGVQGIAKTADGYAKTGKATKPTKDELDALWNVYQHYGTLDETDAYTYVSNLRSTADLRQPDATTLLTTISASGASAAVSPSSAGTPQAPSGPADTVKADAQSAVDKIGDPALSAFISQALAGGPTSSANVSYWNNLGVDPQAQILGVDYRAQHGYGPVPSYTTQQTADEWLGSLYKMSPTDLAEVQHKLWQQGWYEGTNATNEAQVNYGRPDAATLEAYGLALAETARYNHAGRDIGIDDVIKLGSPTKGQAKGTGSPFEKTNPADLKVALQSEAQQNLGRDVSDADVAAFSGQFLGQEDAARRALIGAQGANQTVGVTGTASPTAGADEYIDTHHLADKVAYGAAVRQQAFFSMLKSPV